MTNVILAIDPGKSTGVADIRWRPDSKPWVFDAFMAEYDPFELYELIEAWFGKVMTTPGIKDVRVVYERWIPMANGADPNYSCQLIGAIRVAAGEYKIPVHGQVPKERDTVTSDQLRAAGYWVKSSRDDIPSAIKHGMAHLLNTVRHRGTQQALRPRKLEP